MTVTCKTTKINKGIYQLDLSNGESFQIEQYPDGAWIKFVWCEKSGNREYAHDYGTKRSAIRDTLEYANS